MKSEKEKMLTGQFYNPYDEELNRDRKYARNLTFQFNQTHPSEGEKRKTIIKQLVKAKGVCGIEPPFYCDYGYNIEIGENFFANFGCVMLDCATIRVGDNVLLGPNVQLYTPIHPLDAKERQKTKGIQKANPVVIGNDVWIGGGAIICAGVRIGNNTTIGAGSVVTKDIPDNVVAVGNPCKVIKEL